MQSLGPGQQPRGSSVSIRRLLVLLLPSLAVFWLWNTRYPPVREVKLYLTEDRPAASLPWGELSEAWTEARVQQHFTGHRVRCMPNDTRLPDVDRLCVVDMASLNGVPTMTATFFFGRGQLAWVSTQVPWWQHARGLRSLVSAYGPPTAGQPKAVDGVRLIGWQLPGGAALLYNGHMLLNPLEANSIQWTAPSRCTLGGCGR